MRARRNRTDDHDDVHRAAERRHDREKPVQCQHQEGRGENWNVVNASANVMSQCRSDAERAGAHHEQRDARDAEAEHVRCSLATVGNMTCGGRSTAPAGR